MGWVLPCLWWEERSVLGIWKLYDAVCLIPDSRIGRVHGPQAESCVTPVNFLVLQDCSWEAGKEFTNSELLICGVSEGLSGTVSSQLGGSGLKLKGH